MTDIPHGSTSLWMATANLPQFPALQADIEADVCVIGGGIAGLTSAYLLAREGRRVVLVEAFGIGAGETGRTTAHFFPPDDRYFEIERGFGSDAAQHVAESYRRATDLVESIVRGEQIDCDFERLDGYLFSLTEKGVPALDKEFIAAIRAGVDVEKADRVPGLSFDTGPALRFLHQAQFHPLKYLGGLADACVQHGARIYGQTRALGIEREGARQVVATRGGRVRADAVVVATNTPFIDRVVMHTKQSGYRTYVIGVRVPQDSVPRVLLWDNGDPYYYVRLQSDPATGDDILIAGGADHKVGQDAHPQHRYDEIEAWVRARYPMAGTVDFRWSGEVMEPADGVAYLGRNPLDDRNVYIITGDSGNGMTHCTAGAMLITDLIMGRDNPWESVYAPSRKAVHGIAEFFKEQANTIAQYRRHLGGGEVGSAQEIPAGEGAILQEGGSKLAVYRDDEGGLHVVSATCTHLGCVVAWNSAEKSWDCPCHASRFDVDGDVLHGPALKPLQAVALRGGPADAAAPAQDAAADKRPRQ